MRFPNAYRGVKAIWLAELLGLISYGASILFLILQTVSPDLVENVFGAGLALGILLLGIAVWVLTTLGVFRALKDEPVFRRARPAVIAVLALFALSFGLVEDGALKRVLTVAKDGAALWCVLCVLKGILSLARRLKNAQMVERGKAVYTVILLAAGGGLLLDVVIALIPKSTSAGSVISMILTLLVMALAVGESLLLYFYLRHAVRMLWNTKQK